MKKSLLFYTAFTLCGYLSSAQTVKEHLDKQNNSANKANAAKADVIVMKKMMSDSTQLVKIKSSAGANRTNGIVHKKKKKKLCNHKCKHH